MKVKLTKKALCAVLSLLMVITSLPLTVFAYDVPKASNLYTALEKYRAAMDGTIYTKMTDAYNAYVEAEKIYDQYYYGMTYGDSDNNGVTAEEVDRVTDTLNTKTDDMIANVWVPGSNITEVNPTQEFKDTDWTKGNDGYTFLDNRSQYFNNILYAEPLPQNPTGSVTVGNANVSVYYGNTVVFYSSKDNEPVVPVVAGVSGGNLYSIYPNQSSSRRDSSDISLGFQPNQTGDDYYNQIENLVGKDSGKYNYWVGTQNCGSSDFGYTSQRAVVLWGDPAQFVASNYENGVIYAQNPDIYSTNHVINGIKVNAPLSTEFTKEITPSWYVGAGSTANMDEGYITNDGQAKIYVVNYDAVIQAVEKNSQKLCFAINERLADDQSNFSNVITAFENAMALNISKSDTYNYQNNTSEVVKEADKAISKVVNDLNNAEKKADPSEYQALRDAIDNQRARYEENLVDGKIDTSLQDTIYENWNNENGTGFVQKYEAALKKMDEAVEKDYPNDSNFLEEVSRIANELNNFVLQAVTPRVNTILLENAIDNAQYVLDNSTFFVFTSNQSQEKIENAIKEAKTAIWGDPKNYPLDKHKKEDTLENEDAVLEQLGKVINTIRNLKINLDANVAYAGNYSYNSAMTKARECMENETQYANSSILDNVIKNAEFFANDSNALNVLSSPNRQNNARDTVDLYKSYVLALYDAINSLVPSFSFSLNSANGSIISSNSESPAQVSITHSPNSGHPYNFTFHRNTDNRVFLRTTAEKADFDLDAISMTWSNTSVTDRNNKRIDSQMLDAINFNLSKDTNWNEAYTNSNNPDNTISSAGYTGSLTANDAVNGADFVVSGIHVISGGNNAGGSFGRHSDKTWIPQGDFDYSEGRNLWDKDLSTVDANTPNTLKNDGAFGGVHTFNNSTEMRANYTLRLPENTSYSDLSATTLPSLIKYEVNKKVGIVFTYHNRTGTVTKTSNIGQAASSNGDAEYTSTAQVIDITPLLKLINEANILVNNQSIETGYYTTSSLTALTDAIAAADDEFDYKLPIGTNSDNSSETWMGIFRTRYTNLWNAMQNLKKRADFDTHYKTNSDETFSYDAAKDYLYQKLNESRFTINSLKELDTKLDDFKYLNYSLEERFNIGEDEQLSIDYEIQNLLTLADTYKGQQNGILEKVNDSQMQDYDAARADVLSLNADAYNVENIQNAVNENTVPSEEVDVNGKAIIGYDTSNIETLISNILTAKTDNWYEYSVTVIDKDGNQYYLTDKDGNLTGPNSEDGKAVFHYGDIVKVKSFDEGNKAAFSTEVIAKGTDKQSEKRLITTATEYEFDVRGDTTVYVSATESDEQVVKVTFRDNQDNRIVAVDYATKNEAYDMGKAPVPQFMFYTIKDFTVKDGTNEGAGATVSKDGNYTFNNDTEVIINYEISSEGQNSDKYDIKVYDLSNSNIENYDKMYGYNVRVRVTVDGAAAFVDADTYDSDSPEVIAYGNSYAFYTCQDITLRAVDEAYLTSHNLNENNHQVSVIKTPVIDGNTAQVVGTFAFPENAKPKQYGIVLDASGNNKDSLTLGMVSNAAKIYNFSCSKIIGDNQFAASVTFGTMPSTFSYVAYVIYHDNTTGKDVTVYSPIKTYSKGA